MPPKTTRKRQKKDQIIDDSGSSPSVVNSNDVLIDNTYENITHITSDENKMIDDILESTETKKVDIELYQEPANVLEEPVVLQLAIQPSRMNELISGEDICSIMKYNPVITEPQPYCPDNNFLTMNDTLYDNKTLNETKNDYSQIKLPSQSCNIKKQTEDNTYHDIKCYWCCHQIIDNIYGMPIRYDAVHSSFSTFGSFCSLQCAAAYNYSTNMGCNRVWEIHSWIQLLGKKYGFKDPIRPAPSKYLLKMFNGNMDIDEFRKAHLTMAQTYITNIPPFIHINSQMDIINTSFLTKNKDAKDTKDTKDAKDAKDTKDTKDSKDTKDVKETKEVKKNKLYEKLLDDAQENAGFLEQEPVFEKVREQINHDTVNIVPHKNIQNNIEPSHIPEVANVNSNANANIEKKKRAPRTPKSSLEQKMNLIIT